MVGLCYNKVDQVGRLVMENKEVSKLEDIFKNIDPEKKDRIINSALEEFSKNRFDKASTNNIVKNAGISKGLLFHYFTSKKSLYEYLKAFAMETMVKAILEEIDWEETDLLLRIKQIVLIKFKVAVRYPRLIAFTKILYEHKSIEEIKALSEPYAADLYSQAYHRNIDFTLFKDHIDSQRAIKMTQWVMEKLGEEWMTHFVSMNDDIDYDGFTKEMDEYLKMLKEVFYK